MNIFYYKSEEEFVKIHHSLKQRKCPHCYIIGNLILHGYLKGYAPDHCTEQCKRGHRIYCSNRGNRKGCGRTFSILLAIFMKRFMFCTNRIFNFLKDILEGVCTTRCVPEFMSVPSGYRIRKLFEINQHHIREKLLQKERPPFCCSDNPLLKTINHLVLCFPDKDNPIQAFQQYFQMPFFTECLPEYGLLR